MDTHQRAVEYDEAEDAKKVLETIAEEKHAPLTWIRRDEAERTAQNLRGQSFILKNKSYRIRMHGSYQLENASLALRAMEQFVSPEAMREGLCHVRWKGRLEAICFDPPIILDGAHNPGAVQQIVRMLSQDEDICSLLFAVCSDKDYESMISMLSTLPWKHIYITKIETARGAGVATVADCFSRYSQAPITIYDTSGEAFEEACGRLGQGEKLLCLGSLYLAGELKEHLDRKEREGNHD